MITKEKLEKLVLPILQGLLASGHYTINGTEDSGPRLHKFDNGKEYKTIDNPPPQRYTAIAIEDAIEITIEFESQIDREIRKQSEP